MSFSTYASRQTNFVIIPNTDQGRWRLFLARELKSSSIEDYNGKPIASAVI